MTKPLWIMLFVAMVPLPVSGWEQDALSRLKDTGRCEGCDLSGADLRWSAVYGAELGGAANLVDGKLDGANLRGANLYGGNVDGASFRGADLSGVNLSWASLIGADLTGADLTGAITTGATFCGTIMPDGMRNDQRC